MNEEKKGNATADVAKAVAALRKSAEEGNAEAQFRLGVIYGNGDEGVEIDHQKAMAWFSQAARQGHENALITMAWMYANGAGVDMDEDKARELYLMAADHGSAKAQYVVATMFRFAQFGAEKDLARALHYYTESANQGFATAQFALGKMLVEGKLVEKDMNTALQWLTLAHANGSKRAEGYIQELLQQMSPEEVERARAAVLQGHGPQG
jgi:TPR repeat protein